MSRLNIFCTSLVKHYFTIGRLHVSCNGHFMCSPTHWISSKRPIETLNTLSGVRILFWISPRLFDILCTSAVKRPVTCFIVYRSSRKQKNVPPSSGVVVTSDWLMCYSGELCNNKMYRQDFRDVDHVKRDLLHCWVR